MNLMPLATRLCLVGLLVLAACDHTAPANTDAQVPANAQGSDISQTTSTQAVKKMKITLKYKDKTYTATLNDSPAAKDFAAMLPMTLTLTDYASTEKVSDLPGKLRKEGSPAGFDPSVRDITYYAPWGNLAIFYKDFGYASGLIQLGTMDDPVDWMNVPGELKVVFEKVQD